MSEIICVTNRSLCGEDFLPRIEKIAKARPRAIILREKDLSEADYERLAAEVLAICERYGTPCVLHSFTGIARRLGAASIHLPLPILRRTDSSELSAFKTIGASCHSVEDAVEAERLGCTYITAGHIFATDCKRGVPPRGTEFLRTICKSVSIPVYAIGGISTENISAVRRAGAAGACMMSGLMTCQDPEDYIHTLDERFFDK